MHNIHDIAAHHSQNTPFEFLSDELVYHVFQFIPTRQLLPLLKVSKQFHRIGSDIHLVPKELELLNKWQTKVEDIVLRRFSRDKVPARRSKFLSNYHTFKLALKSNAWDSLAFSFKLFKRGLKELELNDLVAINSHERAPDQQELMVSSKIDAELYSLAGWKSKIEQEIDDCGTLKLNHISYEGKSFERLLNALADTPSVKNLTIESNLCKNEVTMLAQAIDPTNEDKALQIQGISFNMEQYLSTESMSILFGAIARNPSIRSIKFMRYLVNDRSLNELLRSLSVDAKIESLTIYKSRFTEEGMRRLVEALSKFDYIKELNLSNCSREEMQALFPSLKTTHLETLTLRNCFISKQMIFLLKDAIKENITLKTLVLVGCDFSIVRSGLDDLKQEIENQQMKLIERNS